MARRLQSSLVAIGLLAPLVALTGWVVRGAVGPGTPRTAPAPPAPPAALLPGLPPHTADLAEGQLEERVDGAADALRAEGCRRLVYWRFDTPPADAEVLVFRAPEGARRVLDREAGPDRTSGPGDEAQVSEQAVYFREGAVLVRLFLDPGAPAEPGALLRRAEELHRALREAGAL
jgi:hypothetical protein